MVFSDIIATNVSFSQVLLFYAITDLRLLSIEKVA